MKNVMTVHYIYHIVSTFSFLTIIQDPNRKRKGVAEKGKKIVKKRKEFIVKEETTATPVEKFDKSIIDSSRG